MQRKRGYIFTNKKHSEKGIMSTVLGVISLGGLCYGIVSSYYLAGDIPPGYGSAAFLALLMTLVGLVLGITSLRDHDRFLFFSHLGIVFCGLALLLNAVVMYVGVN